MKITETRKYDIIVCGCGVAGFAAALAAARQGKKVAMVERQGMPGGILTVGGNDEIALFFAHKHLVIKGIGWAFANELVTRGEGIMPDWHHITDHPSIGVKVNPLAAAALMDEWMTDAGVALYYNQPVVDCDVENSRILRIYIGTKQGLMALEADCFIDCTGDADLATFAGAETVCGDPETGECMPGTLRYYQQQTELSTEDKAFVEKTFREARADGRLKFRDLWAEEWSPASELYTKLGNNIGHVLNYNAADSDSLTQAEIRGRQSVMRVKNWIRENGLGGDIITAAPNVASRESRRVVGDTVVTGEDYVAGRVYEDAVCYSFYPIDLHRNSEDGSLFNIYIKEGVYPTLPLSMLFVKGLTNLMAAGRCGSGDRLAQSAFRVKSSCMAMGEAAGVAAALCKNGEVRTADLEQVRATLRKSGCLVPPDAPEV